MKILLRILGYGGVGLIILAIYIENWTFGVAGVCLILIAFIEALIKYGDWEEEEIK